MEYDATMVLRNTFFKLRLENHDEPREEVEKDADHLARVLGATYLYLEEIPTES
jgi:hypothetical protein